MTTASRKHPLILLLYNLVLVVGLIIGAVIQASPEELLHFVLVQVDVTTIVAVFVVVHIAGAALTDAFSFQTIRPLSLFFDRPQLALVAGAAAEVSGQVFLDFLFRGIFQLLHHGQDVHNEAGAAKAALLAAFVS